MIVAVTGANGYIGRRLCDEFIRSGHQVRALVSDHGMSQAESSHQERFRCELPDHVDESGILGADAVIHLAYATQAMSKAQAARINEQGTAKLRDLARRHGAFFIFVSSMSAHADGPSYYSISKYRIEQTLNTAVDAVVRPGLVMSNGPDGLFGRMVGTLRKLPVVPVFGSGLQPIYTVGIGDLSDAIARIVERKRPGIFAAAHPQPAPYKYFYRMLAQRLKRRVVFVPVPFWPTVPVLRSMEKIGIKLPITSENIMGVQAMRPVQMDSPWAELELSPSSFEDNLGMIE